MQNVIIADGSELRVTGPTDGTEGTLTANASGVAFLAGIRTTGATLTVTGGIVDAYGGINASAIGGKNSADAGILNVAGGTVRAIAFPGAYGTAVGGAGASGDGGAGVVRSPRSAFGGGVSGSLVENLGDFGSLQVRGTLRLPSGARYVGTDPAAAAEIVVTATGAILGDAANPAAGATIAGPGLFDNQGVIALNPPAATVSGNNRLVTFDTADADVRVFSPS